MANMPAGENNEKQNPRRSSSAMSNRRLSGIPVRDETRSPTPSLPTGRHHHRSFRTPSPVQYRPSSAASNPSSRWRLHSDIELPVSAEPRGASPSRIPILDPNFRFTPSPQGRGSNRRRPASLILGPSGWGDSRIPTPSNLPPIPTRKRISLNPYNPARSPSPLSFSSGSRSPSPGSDAGSTWSGGYDYSSRRHSLPLRPSSTSSSPRSPSFPFHPSRNVRNVPPTPPSPTCGPLPPRIPTTHPPSLPAGRKRSSVVPDPPKSKWPETALPLSLPGAPDEEKLEYLARENEAAFSIEEGFTLPESSPVVDKFVDIEPATAAATQLPSPPPSPVPDLPSIKITPTAVPPAPLRPESPVELEGLEGLAELENPFSDDFAEGDNADFMDGTLPALMEEEEEEEEVGQPGTRQVAELYPEFHLDITEPDNKAAKIPLGAEPNIELAAVDINQPPEPISEPTGTALSTDLEISIKHPPTDKGIDTPEIDNAAAVEEQPPEESITEPSEVQVAAEIAPFQGDQQALDAKSEESAHEESLSEIAIEHSEPQKSESVVSEGSAVESLESFPLSFVEAESQPDVASEEADPSEQSSDDLLQEAELQLAELGSWLEARTRSNEEKEAQASRSDMIQDESVAADKKGPAAVAVPVSNEPSALPESATSNLNSNTERTKHKKAALNLTTLDIEASLMAAAPTIFSPPPKKTAPYPHGDQPTVSPDSGSSSSGGACTPPPRPVPDTSARADNVPEITIAQAIPNFGPLEADRKRAVWLEEKERAIAKGREPPLPLIPLKDIWESTDNLCVPRKGLRGKALSVPGGPESTYEEQEKSREELMARTESELRVFSAWVADLIAKNKAKSQETPKKTPEEKSQETPNQQPEAPEDLEGAPEVVLDAKPVETAEEEPSEKPELEIEEESIEEKTEPEPEEEPSPAAEKQKPEGAAKQAQLEKEPSVEDEEKEKETLLRNDAHPSSSPADIEDLPSLSEVDTAPLLPTYLPTSDRPAPPPSSFSWKTPLLIAVCAIFGLLLTLPSVSTHTIRSLTATSASSSTGALADRMRASITSVRDSVCSVAAFVPESFVGVSLLPTKVDWGAPTPTLTAAAAMEEGRSWSHLGP
ncbi:hypothetical protein FN846DRAFT_951980 [Sphaerosporella brunnea]|uniref:Uncharacterized protein n=1 Tax=Sphaerosporella brunnea TaxID=1250544 RepID=A0A5J5EVJ0_9PEZI|nr:hypothetical protein FN846DRAFT_951980 [Sphaerosporella brunnea]